MQRRTHPTTLLVLLVLAPIAILIGAYFLLRPRTPTTVTTLGAAFLQTTAPALRFASEMTVPERTPGQQTQDEDTLVSLCPLADGRLMLASYPLCVYFEQDGTETRRLELQTPDAAFFESAGMDPGEAVTLIDPANLEAVTATESGAVWAVFRKDMGTQGLVGTASMSDMALLVTWGPDGGPSYVEDLRRTFSEYSFVHPGTGHRWCLNPSGDGIVVISTVGAVSIRESGTTPTVRFLEHLEVNDVIMAAYLRGGHIFARHRSSVTRHSTDGALEWGWLEAVSPLLQPVPGSQDDSSLRYPHGGEVGLLPDGGVIFLGTSGVMQLDDSGRVLKRYGNASQARSLSESPAFSLADLFLCVPAEDGWLLLSGASNTWGERSAIRTDASFNPIETITFELPEPEVAPPEESEIEEPPRIIDFPLLSIGDIADPRLIRRDFHPIPGGYRAVDHTWRRVLTMNAEFEVTDVLDRAGSIPNGLWQGIDVCRVDSRGITYILDREKGLVQALDPDGNYIRRHLELGMDLFGSALEPKNLIIDSLDRLWIIGEHRMYVLDRDGNLVRIFESRGAPYVRQPGTAPAAVPEHTPLGYTILPSTDQLLSRRDPTEPVTLDVGAFTSVWIAGSGARPQFFYVWEQTGDQVVIFDWSSSERGFIDLTRLAGTTNRGFAVGPDGYCYVIDPDDGSITVLDPLGERVTRIEVEGLPTGTWAPAVGPSITASGTGPISQVQGFVDENGRLLVFDTTKFEFLLIPLRDGDPLTTIQADPALSDDEIEAPGPESEE